MKDNRWTIRSTEWQLNGVRSVARPKRRWRVDVVGQQGVVWTRTAKDRESWRTGGGLLSVVEGHSLESNKIRTIYVWPYKTTESPVNVGPIKRIEPTITGSVHQYSLLKHWGLAVLSQHTRLQLS